MIGKWEHNTHRPRGRHQRIGTRNRPARLPALRPDPRRNRHCRRGGLMRRPRENGDGATDRRGDGSNRPVPSANGMDMCDGVGCYHRRADGYLGGGLFDKGEKSELLKHGLVEQLMELAAVFRQG